MLHFLIHHVGVNVYPMPHFRIKVLHMYAQISRITTEMGG